MDNELIGKQYYLETFNGHYRNICLVSLHSIDKKKIRNKDEYDITYSFLKATDKSIIRKFYVIKEDKIKFKRDGGSGYTHVWNRIYDLDSPYIIDRISEIKNNNLIKGYTKEIQEYLDSITASKDLDKIENLHKFIKELE